MSVDPLWQPEAVAPPRALGRALHRLPRGMRQLIPLGMRESIRQRIGPFAPWERGAPSSAPPVPPGLVTGPPDFVGIGAQKSGTTWWFDLLCRHPAVHHPPHLHKERHFFARYALEQFGPEDVAAYHRWFPRPPGARTGEWTPDYLYQPWAARLLAEAAPDARILVMLRDPIDRLVSGIAHDESHPGGHLGAVVAEAFHRGLYSAAMGPWAEAFAPEQILVLQYERCVADPGGEYERTQRFLGLDPVSLAQDATSPVSPTTSEKSELSLDARRRLRDLYAPDVAALAASFPEVDLRLWPNFAGEPASPTDLR